MAARFMSDRCFCYSGTRVYAIIHHGSYFYGHYFPPRAEFREQDALPYSVPIILPHWAFFATRSISVNLTTLNIYKVVDLAGVHQLWELGKTTAPKRGHSANLRLAGPRYCKCI